MNFKKTNQINNEINKRAIELVKMIYQYNPYDILCNVFIYLRDIQTIDDVNKLSERDKIEIQFSIEFLYGLIVCCDNDKFKNNEFEEKIIFEVMNICESIFQLKEQAMASIIINKEINSENQDYIFDDLIRLDISGKRYDIFEREHHMNTLKSVFKFIKEKYNINEESILDGIEHLKTDAIFGLSKAIDKIDKMINEYSIENENNITDQVQREFQDAFNEMFGLDNFNVYKITKWPKKFINIFSTRIGGENIDINSFDFFKIIKIQNIINSSPIIKIENNYYCIRIPRLLDNFDKILLKHLYKDYEKNKQEIIKSFSNNIEIYTKNIFEKIFGEKAKYYHNNYYKKNGNILENDLLIEFDSYLFIVEIKSGSYTPDLAFENISSHIDTLNSLVSKAGLQISSFEEELLNNNILELFDSNKKRAKIKIKLNKKDYKDIFKIVTTFEGFNEIAARAEKVGIINLKKNIIVCSIDDLEVYGDYFENKPINFINYIINRTIATQNNLINLNDELDHLGLYIEHGCYSITADEIAKKYKDIGMIWFDDYRSPIDNYYNGKYYGNIIEKPTIQYPNHINNIINYLNNNYLNYGSFVGNCLISCNGETQEKFEKYILEMIDFYKEKGRAKYVAVGIDNYLLILSCYIENLSDERTLIRDCYANLKISDAQEAYALFVRYDTNDNVINIKIIHITKNDYQYHNDLEINRIASFLKMKRFNIVIPRKKIGRNELCPCGSGKKYKKCCGG